MNRVLSIILICSILKTVENRPASENEIPNKNHVDLDAVVINSKLDKIYNFVSEFDKQFQWEKSIITEQSQTLNYLFKEIRSQEKRLRRLNRNLKLTFQRCHNKTDVVERRGLKKEENSVLDKRALIKPHNTRGSYQRRIVTEKPKIEPKVREIQRFVTNADRQAVGTVGQRAFYRHRHTHRHRTAHSQRSRDLMPAHGPPQPIRLRVDSAMNKPTSRPKRHQSIQK